MALADADVSLYYRAPDSKIRLQKSRKVYDLLQTSTRICSATCFFRANILSRMTDSTLGSSPKLTLLSQFGLHERTKHRGAGLYTTAGCPSLFKTFMPQKNRGLNQKRTQAGSRASDTLGKQLAARWQSAERSLSPWDEIVLSKSGCHHVPTRARSVRLSKRAMWGDWWGEGGILCPIHPYLGDSFGMGRAGQTGPANDGT